MNLKTIRRAAEKRNLVLQEGYDTEQGEKIYMLIDPEGKRRIQANSKKLLMQYIEREGRQ